MVISLPPDEDHIRNRKYLTEKLSKECSCNSILFSESRYFEDVNKTVTDLYFYCPILVLKNELPTFVAMNFKAEFTYEVNGLQIFLSATSINFISKNRLSGSTITMDRIFNSLKIQIRHFYYDSQPKP